MAYTSVLPTKARRILEVWRYVFNRSQWRHIKIMRVILNKQHVLWLIKNAGKTSKRRKLALYHQSRYQSISVQWYTDMDSWHLTGKPPVFVTFSLSRQVTFCPSINLQGCIKCYLVVAWQTTHCVIAPDLLGETEPFTCWVTCEP